MVFDPNQDVVDTGTPPIPAARAWLSAYDGALGPPIDLSQAAPGAPPPRALLDRLAEAAADPASARYGPILGEPTLRRALAADLRRSHGGDVEADDVTITAGCNLAFVAATMALAKAGEAVILPNPAYFNHAMALKMLGIEPRLLPCRAQDGFVPDPDAARALVDGRVKAIVLVTPNNPTGAIVPATTIRAFADLAARTGVALILDETYRDFLPEETGAPHDLFRDPTWREVLVHLYSFSKAYALPGHRVGALVAGETLRAEVLKLLDTLQICAPRIGQIALSWGIDGLADWRATQRGELNARIATFASAMARAPAWRIASIGAYFAYVRHPYGDKPGEHIAHALAERCGVLGLPGAFFGRDQDGYLRLAFANAGPDLIATVPDRLLALDRHI